MSQMCAMSFTLPSAALARRAAAFPEVLATSSGRWAKDDASRLPTGGCGAACAPWDSATCTPSAPSSGYKPAYWYFEMVELGRKFVLTSLLIFILPGSVTQVGVCAILSSFLLLVLAIGRVFKDPADNVLAMLSNFVVSLIATLTLFLKAGENVTRGYDMEAFSGAFVLSLVGFLAIGAYLTLARPLSSAGLKSARALRALFRNFDVDVDGTLSAAELTDALVSRGLGAPVAARAFELIDANGDGEVTEAEFLARFLPVIEKLLLEMEGERPPGEEGEEDPATLPEGKAVVPEGGAVVPEGGANRKSLDSKAGAAPAAAADEILNAERPATSHLARRSGLGAPGATSPPAGRLLFI